MQKLLPVVALGVLFGAAGCREASDDALGATKAQPTPAVASNESIAPRPQIAHPSSMTPEIAQPDPPARPEISRPEIARPEPVQPQPAGDVVNGLPAYPRDAGVPKEPPDAVPLSR